MNTWFLFKALQFNISSYLFLYIYVSENNLSGFDKICDAKYMVLRHQKYFHMDLLKYVSLGKCHWYSDFKSQNGKSIVCIYHKTYQPLMSPGCPGTYYGSILFSGKSMTKWYQGRELPPSCRCWRLKLKITTLYTLEAGCPRAIGLHPKENSWRLL